MELTLLGTGNPRPNLGRAGPSQHLRLGDHNVLVDCGSGVARRLLEAGLRLEEVDYLFLTHQHSDHTVDLAHFLIAGWTLNRRRPLTIFGPPGIDEFVRRVLHAFEVDLRFRHFEERLPPEVLRVDVREVTQGEVLKTPDWRALAFEADHGPLMDHALGFRFEDSVHRLVISGDTIPCSAVADAAKGADILVHELNTGHPARDPHSAGAELTPWEQRVAAGHSCPHGVGKIAAAARVQRLVLSHLPPSIDEGWIRDTIRPNYDGEVVVGSDLFRVC